MSLASNKASKYFSLIDLTTPNLGKVILRSEFSPSKNEFVLETSLGLAAKGIKN
jgi:hypothetical protein